MSVCQENRALARGASCRRRCSKPLTTCRRTGAASLQQVSTSPPHDTNPCHVPPCTDPGRSPRPSLGGAGLTLTQDRFSDAMRLLPPCPLAHDHSLHGSRPVPTPVFGRCRPHTNTRSILGCVAPPCPDSLLPGTPSSNHRSRCARAPPSALCVPQAGRRALTPRSGSAPTSNCAASRRAASGAPTW